MSKWTVSDLPLQTCRNAFGLSALQPILSVHKSNAPSNKSICQLRPVPLGLRQRPYHSPAPKNSLLQNKKKIATQHIRPDKKKYMCVSGYQTSLSLVHQYRVFYCRFWFFTTDSSRGKMFLVSSLFLLQLILKLTLLKLFL